MIKTLFSREIIAGSFLGKGGKKSVLSLLSTLLFSAMFVALICFVYDRLYLQLKVYSGFNRSLFDFVLFSVFILGIVFALPTMHRSFFRDERERIILGSQPITTRQILMAKCLVAWVRNSLYLLITYLPLCIVYGALSGAQASFYILATILWPFLSLLLTGIGLTLLFPFRLLYQFLKRYPLLSFILTIGASFLLAYLYSLFLNLFVDLIQNSSLDLLFTTERIESMTRIGEFLYPTAFLSPVMLSESGLPLLYFLLALIAFLLLGSFLMLPRLKAYYCQRSSDDQLKRFYAVPVDITSPKRALIKKELSLVLSKSDGFFSFISLIAVQPFLIYLVVSAINVIFNTGNFTFIRTLFPNILLSIDTILILLFLSIINSTSSLSLRREGNNIITMKTIPVSVRTQLLIKLLVPFVFSLASEVVSLIVLVATGEIDLVSFLFLLLVGALFLGSLSLSSLRLDLQSKRSDAISLILDFLLPIAFVLLSFAATYIPAFSEEPIIAFYVTLTILLLALFLSLGISLFQRSEKLFIRYEGGSRT